MSVVISEIQVTATVVEPAEQGASSSTAPAPDNREDLKNEIIKECVDKVMKIILDQKER